MGVFASSLKASFGDVLADQTNADLFLDAVQRPGAAGFSPSVIEAVAAVPRRATRSRPAAGARRGSTARTRQLLVGRPGDGRGGR